MTPNKQFLKTEIIFPGSLPGNNHGGSYTKKGIVGMHWRTYGKLKKQFTLIAMSCSRNRHSGPVRLELIRHSTGSQMDRDNLISTGKLLIDAIVAAGIIQDDKPAIIVESDYSQTKAINAKSQMTVIRILDIEDQILP